MGLLDRFSPFAAERRELAELRESVNFTESLIAHQMAIATGTFSPDAEKTAAVEFAAGLTGRALAVAEVEPERAGALLTPLRLMDIGRRLVTSGNYLAMIEVNRGEIQLRVARQFHVIAGGVDESSWVYEIELAAPGGIVTRRVQSAGVLHVRINPDTRDPWYGTSPLVNAGISADLLARVESKTGEELRAPVGTLLPVPAAMKDERKRELRTDLGDLKGRTAIVETMAEGMGQGRFAAPHQDWQVKRMGAQIPEPHIALRSEVGRDVCSALGIPGALYSGTDGGSIREAYRQLLTATLEPWARIIESEFREKVGYPVEFNFRRLAAADIAARARAYGTMVAAGVDKEEAAAVAGLEL